MNIGEHMETAKKFLCLHWFLVFFLFFSCTVPKERKTQKDFVSYFWAIENKQLREQVLSYFKTVDSHGHPDDVLFIKVLDETPKVKYHLYYVVGAGVIHIGQVHMIAEIEGKVICVSFGRNNPFINDFKLSNESIIKFMERHFPEDYKYYKSIIKIAQRDSSFLNENFQFKNIFRPPSTWAPEVWTLTFKDGKMIDKKIKNRGE